jgi:hypothetical protein
MGQHLELLDWKEFDVETAGCVPRTGHSSLYTATLAIPWIVF